MINWAKSLAISFAIASDVALSSAVWSQSLTVVDPTGTPLNIRGVRGEVLCKVTNGTKVTKLEKDGAWSYTGKEWTLVKTTSGCTGKAWSDYLR